MITLKENIQILLRAYNRPVPLKYLATIIKPLKPENKEDIISALQELVSEGKVIHYEDRNTWGLKDSSSPQFFYVFQGFTFEKEKQGGYLIANKEKDGKHKHFWTRVKDVRKGDVIFHHFDRCCAAVSVALMDSSTKDKDDGGREAWFVRTNYYKWGKPIVPRDYWQDIKPLQARKYAPFNIYGDGNQGYLYKISPEMAQLQILVATEDCPLTKEMVRIYYADKDENGN